MNPKDMLKHMCDSGLTTADRKAICKARGFPAGYAFAEELLQHVFLSDTGVKKVIGQLDEKERIFLNLMSFMKKNVDITFFTRIYPPANVRLWSATFNKKYKIVFDNVRTHFIRRGIIIFDKESKYVFEKKTILELQRFYFPPEFAVHLPFPITTREIKNPETIVPSENILREKLKEILVPEPETQTDESVKGRLHIKDGALLINKSEFTAKQLQSWNISCWMSGFKNSKKNTEENISHDKLLYFFLKKIPATHWFQATSLIPLLKMAFPDSAFPNPASTWMEALCEKGWNRGCLAKTAVAGTFHYRLAPYDADGDTTSHHVRPNDYLRVVNQNTFAVDLDLISYKNLEIIAKISRMQITGGRLTGQVDFINLSHCLEEIEYKSVFDWLQKHLDGVKKTVSLIKKRRNKTIIHQNIMTAKISDLGLKMMIEKKFANTGMVISINDEFIVFPPILLPEIQKITKKAGHVIKRVNSIEE